MTAAGAHFADSFAHNGTFYFDDDDWSGIGLVRLWNHPALLLTGLPYSLALIAILTAHEMGHYIVARRYGVDATLPFFLPVPTLIGTFGAFIKVRSHIPTKRALFDIGIAGPLAGFIVLTLAMAVGVGLSRVVPGAETRGNFQFGTPALLWLFAKAWFPGVAVGDILVHPIARAAWVGALMTALNLLPIGQLDGGHILYAFVGERSRWLSRIFLAMMIPLAYFAWNWLIWAVLLFFLALRHTRVYDDEPLDRGRRWLGASALAMLILCFMLTPVRVIFT
jgi:membrane-associated protease RseP (regulator of RpoE activity)